MTRRVGRSDGSHPQGRRRPQPAPPLRPLGGALVRTRTGSAERDRASVLIERFPCLCTTLPFRHGRSLSRPSIGPRTREEAWRREMPGYPDTRIPGTGQVRARPGMTRRVGRSDGSHPQGRRGLQPTPPLRQPFLIPQAPGKKLIISLRRRSLRSLAYAPFGARRSRAVRAASQPGPCHGRRLVGCRARRLLSRSPGRRPGARDCAPRRMARKPSERSERPAPEGNETNETLKTAARSGARRGCAGSRGAGRWSRAPRSPPPAPD